MNNWMKFQTVGGKDLFVRPEEITAIQDESTVGYPNNIEHTIILIDGNGIEIHGKCSDVLAQIKAAETGRPYTPPALGELKIPVKQP